MRVSPVWSMIGIYILRASIFLMIYGICFVPFYVIWDYLYEINKTPGDVTITVGLAKGLTIGLGAIYMLGGVIVGWKLRTHSIYNDILEVDNQVKYAELKAAVREYGTQKGWEK